MPPEFFKQLFDLTVYLMVIVSLGFPPLNLIIYRQWASGYYEIKDKYALEILKSAQQLEVNYTFWNKFAYFIACSVSSKNKDKHREDDANFSHWVSRLKKNIQLEVNQDLDENLREPVRNILEIFSIPESDYLVRKDQLVSAVESEFRDKISILVAITDKPMHGKNDVMRLRKEWVDLEKKLNNSLLAETAKQSAIKGVLFREFLLKWLDALGRAGVCSFIVVFTFSNYNISPSFSLNFSPDSATTSVFLTAIISQLWFFKYFSYRKSKITNNFSNNPLLLKILYFTLHNLVFFITLFIIFSMQIFYPYINL